LNLIDPLFSSCFICFKILLQARACCNIDRPPRAAACGVQMIPEQDAS
jgi:hypothetical protein